MTFTTNHGTAPQSLNGADRTAAYLLYDDVEYEAVLRQAMAAPRWERKEETASRSAAHVAIDIAQFDDFLAVLDEALRPRRESIVGRLGNLVALIEQRVPTADRRGLCQLLADAQPSQSKWFDANKPGKAELYDALERVLSQLKQFAPHSLPFIHRVSRKDVPDYYEVIKRPMDLGTMFKKLKSSAYANRAQVLADLELIYANCFTYNTDPESPFRRHATLLKDRWQALMPSVPDITIGARDEIDTLLTAHLDQLEEDSVGGGGGGGGGSSSSMSQSPSVSTLRLSTQSMGASSGDLSMLKSVVSSTDDEPFSLTIPFPGRGSLGMEQYYRNRPMREHVELLRFHQCFPDGLSIARGTPATPGSGSGEAVATATATAMDEALRERCEKMRLLFNPSATGADPLPIRFPACPPSDLMTPQVAASTLQSRIGWLLLHAGFQGYQLAAARVVGDLAVDLMESIWRSIKLYIERGMGLGRADPVERLAGLVVGEHFGRGPAELVRFLLDEPERAKAKLERAMAAVEERRLHHPLPLGGGRLEQPAEESANEAVPEEDVDLDLLGDAGYGWSLNQRPLPTPASASDQHSSTMIESGPEEEPSLRELLDGPQPRLANGLDRKRSQHPSLPTTPPKRPRSSSDQPGAAGS